MKFRGAQRMPITRARLKLSVARVDSVAPRRSKEKEWRRLSCWGEVLGATMVAR